MTGKEQRATGNEQRGENESTYDSSLIAHCCSWCHHRPAETEWDGKQLCRGCWIDLTVCEFVRVWRDDPGIRESLAYKGVDLASPFEYDLLHELIREFAFGALKTADPYPVEAGLPARKEGRQGGPYVK